MLFKSTLSLLLLSNVLLASGMLKVTMRGESSSIETTFTYKDENNGKLLTKDRCETSMHIINGEITGVGATDDCTKILIITPKLKQHLQEYDVHQSSTAIQTQLTLSSGTTVVAGLRGKNAKVSSEGNDINVVVSNDAGYVRLVKDYVEFTQKSSPVNMDWMQSMFIFENGYVLLKAPHIETLAFSTRSVSASEFALPNDIASEEEGLAALNRSGSQEVQGSAPQEQEHAYDDVVEENEADESMDAIENAVTSVISSFF